MSWLELILLLFSLSEAFFVLSWVMRDYYKGDGF